MLRVPRSLFIITTMAALSSIACVGVAQAQESDGSLTAVCISSFESPIRPAYLTDEQIEEINQLEQDPLEPPVPEIVGYPDPLTGSCATEDGVLIPYDPELNTPICVPSGPERNGPLVVVLAINHYLPGYENVVFADPVTGVCPDQETSGPSLVEALVEKLRDILREVLE